MYADDIELYKPDSPSEAFTLAQTIESCISDVKVWVVQNELQLNDDKMTTILLTGSGPGIDLHSSLCVGESDIPFPDASRNLSAIFHSQLALKERVNKLCQQAYLEIRLIGSIRRYLSSEATKTLVSSLVLPRLDYCNAPLAGSTQALLDKIQRLNKLCQQAYLEIRLIGSIRIFLLKPIKTLVSSLVLPRLDYCNAPLAGSTQVLLDKIQRVINCSSRLIFKTPKSAYITPLSYDLHWLPISSRIQYKIALICFQIASGTAPPYLSELLHLYSLSRSLRSASETRIFRIF